MKWFWRAVSLAVLLLLAGGTALAWQHVALVALVYGVYCFNEAEHAKRYRALAARFIVLEQAVRGLAIAHQRGGVCHRQLLGEAEVGRPGDAWVEVARSNLHLVLDMGHVEVGPIGVERPSDAIVAIARGQAE